MEAVIGTIGVVTIGSIVGSIATVSSSIYTLTTNIKVSKHIHNTEIIKILTRTDIIATIKLLQAIMTEIPENYINSISVVMALKNVQEIIENIEDELRDLHKKIEYNNSLYVMTNWRSFDCKDNLDSIEEKISVLDRRKDNLFRILETFKNLEINHTDENRNRIKKILYNYNDTEFEMIDKHEYPMKNLRITYMK